MFSILMRLIGRLSVGRKLVLIYALDLSAVLFVSTILINEKFIAIDFARKEIVGNQYIGEVRDVLLTSNLSTESTRTLKATTSKLENAESNFGSGMDSKQLSHELLVQISKADNGSRQDVIKAGEALITRIGNQSNLILDPDLDSYYTMSLIVLRFPELLEVIQLIYDKAQDRANISRQDLDRVQTEYLLLEGRYDSIVKGITADFAEGIAAGRPEFKSSMGNWRDRLLVSVNAYRDSSRRLVIDNERGAGSPDLIATKTMLMNDVSIVWTATGHELERLLTDRISGLFQRMWLHLGTAGLLLALILSVVFFVARQIALPLRQLADLTDKVSATANYALRATWQSGDELGRLVKGFNSMLEQLNESRLIAQEMAASRRAADAQRVLVEAIPMPLLVTGIPKHEVLHTNAEAHGWLESQASDPWIRGLSPLARARFFQQLSDQGEVHEFEALWQGPKGQTWALISASRLQFQGQDALLTTFTPINSQKMMEENLALWGKVFEASSESIMITDASERVVNVNPAFCRNTRYEFSEIVGQLPNLLRSERHPEGFISEVWRQAGWHGSWQGELWITRKSGDVIPLWAVVNAVRDSQRFITHYIFVALDISDQKANEQRISHLAHHDVLTDLPNRSLCIERLRMALQQGERLRYKVGVLFMDLDRFKNINDSLGHHVGDILLRSVARRLSAAVRPGDTVSRLGGDEFVIILNGVVDIDEITQIVNSRLIPLVRQAHDIDGVELQVSCSVGIAVYPDDGTEIDTLMRNADAAMYQAKSLGRNNAQFFTADMDFRVRERMKIEKDLRFAIERGELQLYYQPRVDCTTGKLLGAEALVRWRHPEQGLVLPARFIPIAEECGLIVPMGAWIFDDACRQQASWRDQGLGDISISVNLSVAQMHDPDLISTLRTSLANWNNTPDKIELELTETLLMENVDCMIDLLVEIKDLGLSLSIDDFGTGYSSLNYLHRFPIDKLKIDQSFVRDMLDDPKDLLITRAIIGLGHTLNLKVVAEGVENKEEAHMLSAAGCDELQGYLFSPPLPPAEFVAWAKANDGGIKRQGRGVGNLPEWKASNVAYKRLKKGRLASANAHRKTHAIG
ncbi:MAG: EAL domain-containing protein [Rhodocyclaceae bacterium]|nr:EAL domain-containing protein [Rhodocyclaceae bacterium]